jgi:quinol monooxygenase YgiN
MTIAWIADMRLREGCKAAFLAITRPHAARCLALEKGCLRFEILQPEDDHDRVVLVEIYADRNALHEHVEAAHLAAFRERVAPLIAERTAFASDLEAVTA